MRTADPAGSPDPIAPIPALPVCVACGHLWITHRRRRCRARDGGRLGRCSCTRFTEPSSAPAGGNHPDPDVTEGPPA
ncbi:hypothetical protein ACG83_15230 [Frankia sp. R43]|nr:hypothetical protein ACG83_15230 [Frankia sp. R43]